MPDRSREVAQGRAPGARAPVLGAALLARVQELNRDYVELLLAERPVHPDDARPDSLPSKVLDALGRMPAASRQALATTPFTLYSLGFDDPSLWTRLLADTLQETDSIEARYGTSTAASLQAVCCEIALFLAWHTAASNRVAARVLFALPDPLATRLLEAPLWQLRRIATDYPALLTPRWPANPAFWPDLIRFAEAGDVCRLKTAQLLGNQLIATDLEGLNQRQSRRLVKGAR